MSRENKATVGQLALLVCLAPILWLACRGFEAAEQIPHLKTPLLVTTLLGVFIAALLWQCAWNAIQDYLKRYSSPPWDSQFNRKTKTPESALDIRAAWMTTLGVTMVTLVLFLDASSRLMVSGLLFFVYSQMIALIRRNN